MGFLSFLGLGGSKKAAQKANASAGEQSAITNAAFDKAEGVLAQFAQQGGAAAELYNDFIGVNGPERQQRAFQSYIESPELQFLQQEGQAAVERSAASNGGLLAGRTLADLNQRGQQISSQGFQNNLTRLAGAGQQGFQANTNLANLATGRGNALAGIEGQRGLASQRGVLGTQAENVGLTGGLANIASFGLGGGFDKALSGLQGGAPTDFRRVF